MATAGATTRSPAASTSTTATTSPPPPAPKSTRRRAAPSSRRGEHDSYGNYLIIQHSGTLRTLYAHCQSLLVSAGDIVSAGDVVALVGATGEATGPHLHFEVIASGTRFSPDWVQFAGEGG